VLHDYALYKSTFTLLYFTLPPLPAILHARDMLIVTSFASNLKVHKQTMSAGE